MNRFKLLFNSLRANAVLGKDTRRKAACTGLALCLLCSICLAGCVSSLWSKKAKTDINSKSDGRGATTKEGSTVSGSKSTSLARSSDKSSGNAGQERSSRKAHNPGPGEQGEKSGESAAKPPRLKSNSQSLDDADSLSDSFKKHDHSKYMQYVRNKAIDLINNQQRSDYVVMCKDNSTDQWTLSLYQKGDRVYSFVTYVWDTIDEKWVESFVSNKSPMSRWKNHIRYSASGKDCNVLKGRSDSE